MALIGLLLAVFLIIILACLSVYKYVRPLYPVKVNCWFCSTDTVVPYGNKNCWDCPVCLQYNGFNKDGDYNKPIPTQYDGDLNHPVSCVQSDFISKNDVLCEKCSRNQLLKTKQLAAFVPMNEANFDAEVTAFEGYLEKLYRLCSECQTEVNKELSKQDDILQQKLENIYTECSPLSSEVSQIQIPEKSVHLQLVIGRIMEAVSTVCGLLLLLSSVSHFADFKDSEYHRYVETFMVSFKEHRKLIGMVGLVTSIVGKITIGKDRLRLPDALQIPLWLTALCIQQESDSMSSLSTAEPIVLLCNVIASAFCLLLWRKSRTSPSINIRRLSLDVSKSSSSLSDTSKGSELYSASQVGGDLEEEELEIIEEDPENLDDTLSELEAVSLGLPASRIQKNSGLFTSSFTNSSRAPSNFSSSSTAQALREKRPLISPAKLGLSMQQRSSTPTKFQVTTTRSPFIVNQRPCLLPKSVNLFPPQSLQNGLPNGSAVLTASPSFTVPRLYSSSTRRLQAQQLPQREDSEKYSDKSEASKQTSDCLVDSTTKHTAGFSIGEFLNSPGFVGFVLGASMIGNIALACYVFRIS